MQAWLDGEFGMDDEPAMIEAIRKDTRISLSDDDMIDAMCAAMAGGLNAPACLERLVESEHVSEKTPDT